MGQERLAWARQFTEGLIGAMADDQLVPPAGGLGNHALWVMGHLAVSEDDILTMITGKSNELTGCDAALSRSRWTTPQRIHRLVSC